MPAPTAGQGETLDDLFGWLFANSEAINTNADTTWNPTATTDVPGAEDAQIDAMINTMWSASPLPDLTATRPTDTPGVAVPEGINGQVVRPQNISPFAVPNLSAPLDWASQGWPPPDHWTLPQPREIIDDVSREAMFRIFEASHMFTVIDGAA